MRYKEITERSRSKWERKDRGKQIYLRETLG